MSLTYAVPDLHGRYDLLSEALTEINRRSAEAGTIITIGDYVDKGPDSKGVIDRLLAGADAGWNLVTLKGNPRRPDGGGAARPFENDGMDGEGWRRRAGFLRRGTPPGFRRRISTGSIDCR